MILLENCRIQKIIYHNTDNQFTVAKVMAGIEGSKNELITVFYGKYAEGENVNIGGHWTLHPKYGKRFQADYIERSKEMSLMEIECFLQTIKGIGQARAKKIVSSFGKDTLKILSENPERLKEIGIPQSVIDSVKKELQEDSGFELLKRKLMPLGLTLTTVKKIYKQYGDKAYNIVTENPYRLADDINGIGFKKADEIALKLGIDPESDFRVSACIKYVLQKKAQEGHTYFPENLLVEEVRGELKKQIGHEKIQKLIEESPYIIRDGSNVYLQYLFHFEYEIAEKLIKLLNAPLKEVGNIDLQISAIEKLSNINYTNLQKEAIKKSFQNGVSIITGGPGTGKTTIIKAILDIAEANKMKTALAAPTGKAAKRMEEVTGREAKTIHRLLEFKPAYDQDTLGWELKFERDEFYPLDEDMIIIDETSMIDTVLMYYLVRAIKQGTRVVFVGDVDQLPSIGPGTILADIINILPVTKLDAVFRQKEGSLIILNSAKIRRGVFPSFNKTDFQFYEISEPEKIVEAYINELKGGLSINEVQILTPVRKTEYGVENLNRLIQEAVNPPNFDKPEATIGNTVFRVGDKVMQVVNDYFKECFNGDTGVINSIFKLNGSIYIVVDFDGRFVTYVDDEAKNLNLAYAVTVHKAQGSQFDTVIMPLTTKHFIMLKRNLFYTAVTRAKKKVVIFGQKKAIAIALYMIDAEKRYSTLQKRFLEKLDAIASAHSSITHD